MNSRPPYSSIPSEEPASPHAEQVEPNVREAVLRSGFFSISAETFPDLSVSDAESAAALNTGVTANLARFKWLRRRAAVLARFGIPIPRPYPTCAICKFENGRMGDVRFAADAPVRIAGCRGTFTAFLAGPDIPALFRTGALEFPQKVDFRVGCSTAPCSGRGPLGRGDTQSALGFSGETKQCARRWLIARPFFRTSNTVCIKSCLLRASRRARSWHGNMPGMPARRARIISR